MLQRFAQFNFSALSITCLCAMAIWVGFVFSNLAYDLDDFKKIRFGAVDLIQLGDPYASRERNEGGFKYTPVFAYLFQPFGRISHTVGQRIWFALNVVALGTFIALCLSLARSELARKHWAVIALSVIVAPPTTDGLLVGQTGILIALLLVGAYALWYQCAPLSGLLLALAAFVKLYPGLMVVYALIRGPQRVAWWAMGMGLLLIAIFVPFYGVWHYPRFLSSVMTSSNHPYAAEFNLSIYGFWIRLLTDTAYARPIVNAPLLAQGLSAVCCAGLVGLCVLSARHVDGERKALPEYCLWLCVAMLLSPINGSYNSVLLLLPFLVLLRYVEQSHDRGMRVWLILGSVLAVWPPGWTSKLPLLYQDLHVGWGLLLLTPGFYGLLIYTGMLAALIIRPLPEQTSAANPAFPTDGPRPDAPAS